jgi:hypothetical protein
MDIGMMFDIKWMHDVGFDNLTIEVKRLVGAKYRG